MVNLPEQFKDRMKAFLGDDSVDFFKSYDYPAQKGIRVNTLKISAEAYCRLSPFNVERIPWEPDGFFIQEEKPGKFIYHAAGLYYVQEPSAMCAAPLLDVKPGERVLDLCSAPGGKGTQLAQRLSGNGIIFLNEINFSRTKILLQNVERMGIKNCVVTCASPEKLAQNFSGYFDKILVDAPCSGEGMFKKEPNAIPEWSVENVTNCAERQRQILHYAQSMLKPNGRLVYSTCTFAPEEDENQIAGFLKNYSQFTLVRQEKLYPHKVRGEGHFAALMQKCGGEECDCKLLTPIFKDKKLSILYKQFEEQYLHTSFSNLHLIGTNLYSLPNGMPQVNVQMLRAGVHLGEFVKDRFEPSHSLAMCLKADQATCIEVDEQTALSYLAGNTFDCDQKIKGWALVTYNNFPIGWCKAVNGTAKNHLPKGLRI